MTTTQTTDLYWEIRGSGPAVLLIPGTPGDGGQFDALAAELAAHRTVVTYDRRGTSRSARPALMADASAPMEGTSPAEQADDARAVIAASGLTEVLVYGTSNGAIIALELAQRHPGLVRSAIVHEPPLMSVLADPEPVAEYVGSVIGAGMAADGTRGGLLAFLTFAFGERVVAAWSDSLRERMLTNADLVFGVELPAFQTYRPDPATLQATTVPTHIVVGAEQQTPFFHEAATWLAANLGVPVETWPGAHGPHFTHPHQLAAAITDADRPRP